MQSFLMLPILQVLQCFCNSSSIASLRSNTRDQTLEGSVWVCTAPDNWQLVITIWKTSASWRKNFKNCFLVSSVVIHLAKKTAGCFAFKKKVLFTAILKEFSLFVPLIASNVLEHICTKKKKLP